MQDKLSKLQKCYGTENAAGSNADSDGDEIEQKTFGGKLRNLFDFIDFLYVGG